MNGKKSTLIFPEILFVTQMETPDGKLQTITVPAGNFSVSKRPSPPQKAAGGGRGRKRPASSDVSSPPGSQEADRNLYSLVSTAVSPVVYLLIIRNSEVISAPTKLGGLVALSDIL
jgi:hypothetical protein